MNRDTIFTLVVCIVLLAIGFVIGRSTTEPEIKTEVEYIPSDPIHDTTYVKEPEYIEVPSDIDTLSIFQYCLKYHLYDYLIPERIRDSLIYVQVDSSKIIKDWVMRRDYEITLFDCDTLGRLDIKPSVQYNQLCDQIPYQFIPKTKQITTEIQTIRLISPFVGLGLNNNYQIGAMGGLFINEKWGGAYQYQFDIDRKIHLHGFYVLRKF